MKSFVIIIINSAVLLALLNLASFFWLVSNPSFAQLNERKREASSLKSLEFYKSALDSKEPRTYPNLTFNDLNSKDINLPSIVLQNRANSRIIYGEESDGLILFKTDKFGYRNQKSLPHYDILLLGDSFTEGAQVPDPFTISEQLNAQGFATFNGGKGGTGLGYFAIAGRKLANDLNPNIIIVNVLQGASISRLINEVKEYPDLFKADAIYLQDDELLSQILNAKVYHSISKKSDISLNGDELITKTEWLKNILRSTSIWQIVIRIKSSRMRFYSGEGIPKCDYIVKNRLTLRKAVSHLGETARMSKSRLVFIFIPNSDYYLDDINKDQAESLRKDTDCEVKELEDAIRAPGVTGALVDLRSTFTEGFDSNGLSWIRENLFSDNFNGGQSFTRGHPSRLGYEIISGKIARYLKE